MASTDITVAEGETPPGEKPLRQSHLTFAVCGLGASAGGVEALLHFFENMPAKNGMAFVVIVHLSPMHESNLDTILQRATEMPVVRVTQPTPIEVDHVYVISPTMHLSMDDGHLTTSARERSRGRPTAVDIFFRTLGEVHRERAISVVLSGTGADGAVGISRVKEYGGVTFAQAPDDAQQDSMPRAAIATGAVDFVMRAAEMPGRMVELVANARNMRLPIELNPGREPAPITDEAERRFADEALHGILGLVRSRTRHDFGHYKRGTILRRIERRMQVHLQPTLPAYLDYLRRHPQETGALFQDLLISVTDFFRDRDAYAALEERLGQAVANHEKETIRIWVAGCATGEEAYSIAMLAQEIAERLPNPRRIQVFASDIDERAIAIARTALYPKSIVADVSSERLRRFFNREPNHYRVRKGLRDSVLFAVHNVLRDPPFSRLDLVCCRNVLIYLDRKVQDQVLETFHFALRNDGLLFLGTSEQIDAGSTAFVSLDKKNRIYGAVRDARPHALPPRVEATQIQLRPPDAPSRESPRSSLAQLHQDAIDEHVAPSILIDGEHNILHVSEGASRFLTHQDGIPTTLLLENVSPALRLELRAALFKAGHTQRSVQARAVRFHDGVRETRLSINVVPVDGASEQSPYLLVVFTEVDDTLRAEPDSQGNGEALVVATFEAEVRHLRQHLQETIEDAETSTEELRASNEELQSVNEELRSATEELETSKEELQSMNEELTTINDELREKVDETAKVNDDLRNLIASVDLATIFVDNALRIQRFTPRALDLFSLIPGDVGRPLLDINHRLDYDAMAEDLSLAFDALKTTERRIDSRDGRHYLARVLPYRTDEHRIEGAVITFVDIPALHRAEERARIGEEQLRLAAATTRDYAIMTTDEAGIITTWNAGAERVFGYTMLEAVGLSADLIFTPEDRAVDMPARERETARVSGRAEDDRWHLRKDGVRIFVSGVMTPFVGDTWRGYAKIARDITNTKQEQAGRDAALAREQSQRVRSEAANRLKDEFLAVMSHELKHPLNLILVNAELLTRLPGASNEPSVGRAVQIIRNAVIGQGKIIDDLLDLSRMTTGKLTLDLAPIDIDAIVETIVASMADDAAVKGLALNVAVEPGLDLVLADAVRVDQIVFNLLSNALKFTDAGSIDVRLERDGDFARLTVADTGKGIAREFLPRVFEMFSQEHRRPHREQGGLGIGLALVLQLALAHGGRVEATSDGIGKGSTFRVWLPFDAGQKRPRRGRTTTPKALDGLRMLVVDDSRDSLEPFVELLRFEGASAVGVTSGAAALERVDEEDYDVIISDLAMPDIDGFELIAELRRRDRTKHVVAIALSGYSRDKDHKDALRAGFDAHIGKPASIVEVRRVVNAARGKLAT